MPSAPKNRLDVRIDAAHKEEIQRAAGSLGMPLSTFINGAALDKARLVNQQARMITLAEEDFDRLLDLIENPPKPTAELIALFSEK